MASKLKRHWIRTVGRRCFLLPTFIAASVLGIAVSSAAVLDKQAVGPARDLLLSLAAALDGNGIDVILGQAKNFPAGEKPRLAALSGFSADKVDWGSLTRESWEYGFYKGMIGSLFAVKAPGKSTLKSGFEKKAEQCTQEKATQAREECAFVNQWINAPPESRVFVAFTKSDIEAARKVKNAMEKAGYVVFVYLRSDQNQPWAEPQLVGEAFAQSRHTLVIDSSNSRGSSGVAFEAMCGKCNSLLAPPPKPTDPKWLDQLREGNL